MPNIGSALKDEIVRLSRKVQKQGISSLQKSSASYRREIAQLKRDVAALRREIGRVQKVSSAPRAAVPSKKADEGANLRFQVRGLKSLRAKLALSAVDFGKLAGVSGQTIYNWESEKATPRRAQVQALAALRGIGKKQARSKLAGMV